MSDLEAVEDQIKNAWANLHYALEHNNEASITPCEDQLEALHKEQQELYALIPAY